MLIELISVLTIQTIIFAKNKCMRTFFSVLLIMLVLSCSNKKVEGFEIEVKVSSDFDGKLATLIALEKGKPKTIDSSFVNEGTFYFEGTTDSPDMFYIELDGVRGNLPFVLENTDYNITIDSDSIYKSVVKGGKEQEALERFKTFNKSIRDRNVKLGKEVRAAQRNRDTALIAILRKTYDSLNKASLENNKIFIKENNDNVVSALILENLIPLNQVDSIQAKEFYFNFTEKVKNTRSGKAIDSLLN